MLKYRKIINEETRECEVGLGTNENFYKSLGMELGEVEEGSNGEWYEKGYAPAKTIEEQNETIRQIRENLYVKTSDVIRNDYLEAVARGSSNAEQLKQEWLASKDKIREENPYIKE